MNGFYPIDRTEVLKYLHCKVCDNKTLALIDNAYADICKNIKPRFVFRVLDIEKTALDCVSLKNTNLKLCGSDIVKHLKESQKIILIGATLGDMADRLLRTAQIKDMAEAVVLDCTLSAYIESFCEAKVAELRHRATENDEFITSRFSPGYGNFPIEIQKDFLAVLDAQRKIGLTVTKENLLIPTKSVTAVIGVSDHEVTGALATCTHCVLKGKCEFIKSGTTCYKK